MNLPGRLKATTLGDLLGTLHRAEATGTLELAEPSGRTHRVHLSKGLVAAVELDGEAATLGEILRRRHALPEDVLKRSLLMAIASRRLHGTVLVEDYRVPAAIVDEALRAQILARLERLERLGDARIFFRVAVRTPRGALTADPMPARSFLSGKRRARDGSSTPPPSRARAPEVPRREPDRASARLLLGVPAGAGTEDIRRAYRRLARAYHPDLHPAASPDERRELSMRFQAVTEAYRALVA